jgi:hypothetical protein
MGKLRRGGFVFLTWKGDHTPRHVHVYRKGRFVVKWDLDSDKTMKGKPTRKIVDLIRELRTEGQL